MAESLGSIREWVSNTVQGIPTALSGGYIGSIVQRGLFFVQNYTGDTISTTDIPTKYQSVLTNLGCAYLHSAMAGVGVDFNARIGEFSVGKGGAGGTVDENRAQFYIDQANAELQSIGRKTRYAKVYG